MMDMKFQIHTFGCKVNTYDSGLMQKNLVHHGLDIVSKDPQIHVLNTCAVTAEATKEAIKTVRKIKSKSPFSTVVVTGCAAQVDTGAFQDLPGVDLVVANSHKGLLPSLLDQYFKGTLTEKVYKSNIFRKEDLEMGGGKESHHTRSFLKIQDGCNSFCSYCIIPYARGKSRSIPLFDLVKKINSLCEEDVKEVVLTGVHIGDYEDQNKKLEDLIEAVLAQTKIPRIRLTSLEPVELSERLIHLYQNPRLLPHFHMSIQSANTRVLKDMKRNYGQREVIESLEKINKYVPSAFVGMDVIAGFPTETEECFLDTYQTLANTPWTRLHVFPYSERKGTKAEAMTESVAVPMRAERAQKLRELSLHRYQSQALDQVGKKKTVLVQNKPSKGGHGLSEDYWNIKIEDAQNLLPNSLVAVEVTGVDHSTNWIEAALTARQLI